jgi:hypothetical protein
MRAYIQYRIEPVLIVKNAYFLRADLYELYTTFGNFIRCGDFMPCHCNRVTEKSTIQVVKEEEGS